MGDIFILEAISGQVWNGRIQLELMVHDGDLTSATKPPKCFISAPRMAYLPAIAADAVYHLSTYAIEFNSEIWFESNGIPLKW
jgi:hypothetical protein